MLFALFPYNNYIYSKQSKAFFTVSKFTITNILFLCRKYKNCFHRKIQIFTKIFINVEGVTSINSSHLLFSLLFLTGLYCNKIIYEMLMINEI